MPSMVPKTRPMSSRMNVLHDRRTRVLTLHDKKARLSFTTMTEGGGAASDQIGCWGGHVLADGALNAKSGSLSLAGAT